MCTQGDAAAIGATPEGAAPRYAGLPATVSADARRRGARQHCMGRRRHDDPPPQGGARRACDGRRPQCLPTPGVVSRGNTVWGVDDSTTHRRKDCVVPGNTVWGVVDTATHRRKEARGGLAKVAGHSVCWDTTGGWRLPAHDEVAGTRRPTAARRRVAGKRRSPAAAS